MIEDVIVSLWGTPVLSAVTRLRIMDRVKQHFFSGQKYLLTWQLRENQQITHSLSSSYFFFLSYHFSLCVHRPSSGFCRSGQPTENSELNFYLIFRVDCSRFTGHEQECMMSFKMTVWINRVAQIFLRHSNNWWNPNRKCTVSKVFWYIHTLIQ